MGSEEKVTNNGTWVERIDKFGKWLTNGSIERLIEPSADYDNLMNPKGSQVTEPTLEEKLAALEQENILLKAQNNALADRTDFHEELIAELAMIVYP